MKIKLLSLVLIMAVLLSSCTLKASKAPAATPTLGGESTQPGAGDETMGVFGQVLTQTAAAQQSGQVPGVATAVPTQAPGDSQQPPVPAPTTAPSGQEQPQVQPTNPVAAPVPQVELPELVVPSSYTLQKGEFPYCLARRFDIHPADLLNANGLGVNTMVYPGTTLTIPQNGRSFPGERELRNHPATYTAGSGDTIYSIACYYGDVDPMGIAVLNGLDAPYAISAGEVLQIP